MTNYQVSSVDEFVQASPEIARPHLTKIRAAVKLAVPEADEVISYGKPYYKYPKHLVGFDVYKNHVGFEIYSGQLDQGIRARLEKDGYKSGNKSFQIAYNQAVPVKLIEDIVRKQVKNRSTRVNLGSI